MSGKHYSRQYDEELEAVRSSLLKMGGLVEHQMKGAAEALVTGDVARLKAVVKGDFEVNQLESRIDEMCSQIIARRQPTAGDLRELIVIGRMGTDLERIGDAAKKIARLGLNLVRINPLYQPGCRQLDRATNLALEMLSRVLDAFARRDLRGMSSMIRFGEEVDDEYRTILRYLVAYMIDDPRSISVSLETLFIAKAIEQVGDHSCSMAKQLVSLLEREAVLSTGAADLRNTAGV